ncbi:MAG: hypothetical protein CM1200mP41_13110 [Gammaproteobacteria bacterium]|nr:MAG: hypothetical protein CM1200mP41_13110 [Gammaproteobacteria bacterium]
MKIQMEVIVLFRRGALRTIVPKSGPLRVGLRVMGKSLVIVESPAKAKTINRYLGRDFIVKSSVGHVRDLPVSGSRKKVDPKERAKQAAKTRKMAPDVKAKYKKEKAHTNLVKSMGVDPENDWRASYQILPDKTKVVAELQKLAMNADAIYLATDLDREGEGDRMASKRSDWW